MTLTRDSILSADDLPMVKVECPEWKGHVYVRTMTGKERDSFEAEMYHERENSNGIDRSLVNLRAKMVARTGMIPAGPIHHTAACSITYMTG